MDYMPIGDDTDRMPLIVRRLQVLKGNVNWRMRCAPMPDYARALPNARHHDGTVTFVTDGQAFSAADRKRRTQVRRVGRGGGFLAGAGRTEQATFVFGGADDDRVAVENTDLFFAGTLHYWQRWSARSNYRGRGREMVNRSALALKLLTSARHGSIAAPGCTMPRLASMP
ncbi:MAG: hypothetical protein ACR5LG_08765 [Sodalis sp. (in: enterobacteria)]|uniref:hypothetical protein n=1 Tax=Sodalis sp. (in: enterobacteria) TaxID=1898979 RepID=UPI003F2ABAA4